MLPSIIRWTTALALTTCAGTLASCSGEQFGRTFGFIHDAPDEFMVTTRAPLAMPPTYTLPVPKPGVSRPQEQSERAKAELALVPQMALGTQDEASSAGQQALVQAAGPAAPPQIRAEVDQEAGLDKPQQGLADRLMFWRKTPPPGVVVDPEKEAQRLRENAALGQSQETGETPIVQPKRTGWLEGIF
jgi:Protein of unknown function (DUF3035)